VHLLDTFCPARRLNKEFDTKWSKEKLCWFKTEFIILSVFLGIKQWDNSRCILTVCHFVHCVSLCVTVCHCVHCANGKKRQRYFTFHLFSWFTGIENNMLLIIILCLIAKLLWVAGDCNFGTIKLKNFDTCKVGISVLTCLM
jgi:hypothetical protein